MSENFQSARFGKQVWLTNHAIEAMAKRLVTLAEVKVLIEQGSLSEKGEGHAWIAHHFTAPLCANVGQTTWFALRCSSQMR